MPFIWISDKVKLLLNLISYKQDGDQLHQSQKNNAIFLLQTK